MKLIFCSSILMKIEKVDIGFHFKTFGPALNKA